MSVCENVGAMPFQTYQVFLEKIKALRPKMHEYLKDTGFVINDEKMYAKAVSKGYLDSACEREDWERIANKFRYVHLNKIDTFCSELAFLSDSVVQDGTVLFCGCGNGDLTEWVKRNISADVVGLDYSRAMLREYNKRSSKPDMILARCENAPLPDESVKQIIFSGVEFQSIRSFLKESARLMIPDGEFRIDEIKVVDAFFPQHSENFLDALRKAKYAEFMTGYMEKMFGSRESEDDLEFVMDNLDCTDQRIQNMMVCMTAYGFDANYEFSRFPLVPRAYHLQNQGLQIPYAIIGRKRR